MQYIKKFFLSFLEDMYFGLLTNIIFIWVDNGLMNRYSVYVAGENAMINKFGDLVFAVYLIKYHGRTKLTSTK